MNASESIKVAIEFVSKQVDPGGGGTFTPTAQTGDLAFFSIILLFLVCALAFAMFKAKNVFSFENVFVGKHAKSKISHGGGRFNAKAPIIIAVCVALIACLGIATTKAIAANASNGLVVQPDKIQIPIDEETGQPDPVNFKFFNDSSGYYLFNASLMSLTDEAKSLTVAEDWGINISGGNTTIYAGNPDGTTWYDIESIQTLIPAQSIDSVLSFTKFDVNIAKSLIGKQVFELELTYNEQKVAPNPKVNTNLVYNGKEQVGVEEGDGYVLSGVVKGTNAGTYSAFAKLADGYDCWEDGTTAEKQITWTIDKAEGGFTEDPEVSENLVYSTEKQKLIKPGAVAYKADVYYKIEGQTEYSKEIPEGIDAKSYDVKAYIGESENYKESEPFSLTANIEKAVVSNVTIEGATGDATYIKDASYVFPDFEHGDEAYTITSWKVDKGPKNVFKKEQVRPLPTWDDDFEQVIITKASADDIGPHEFTLPDITQWSYLDPNVEVGQNAWNLENGCFTLNDASIVNLDVGITSFITKDLHIGENIEYTVNITNNTEEAISGAKLTFEGVDYNVNTIPAKGNQSAAISYNVDADDFLYYPDLVKKFIFKYNDFSKQVQHQTSLENMIIEEPTLYNGFYDGDEHKFPDNDGYTFLGGYSTSFNAGDYYAIVMRNLGYEWKDWSYDYKVYTWEIKKVDVDIHFDLPAGQPSFTTTYGQKWSAEEQTIVGTTTPGKIIPDSLEVILGEESGADVPVKGKSDYQTWGNVGTYPVYVNILTEQSKWNPNYIITKTDTFVDVNQQKLTVEWPESKIFHYNKGETIQIPFTVDGNYEEEHQATVVYNTYSDELRTDQKDFKEKGVYYVAAFLHDDSISANYLIVEGARPSDVFEIVVDSWPKAVLGADYNLKFIYDDDTYKPDGYFILKVYDITNTSYNGGSSDRIDPEWVGNADSIKKVIITPNFVNCNKCSDGKTDLTSMDSWFANMINLENVEGLENIHRGITSLNATFMNTKLHDYTFPKGFFDGVSSTHSMFKDCSSIEEICVFDWTYENFTNTTSMFEGCSSLKHIYCTVDTNWADLTNLALSDNMFKGCTLLHKYSELKVDNKKYAKVDKGDDESTQGYFEFPSHDYLYQYSTLELKDVSDYLAENYTETSTDPVCEKFRNFRDGGLTEQGTDNGIAMNNSLTCHWAIDKNGKLFGQEGFVNDNTTIQARIIGICEDKDEDGNVIGLTFMTTHAINTWLSRQVYHDKDYAAYGWGGDSPTGACALRTKLNDGSLFPKSLIDSVKKAAKGFQFSGSLGSGIAYDKFWAPSMFEMYGQSGGSFSGWWPDENEGIIQYQAFVNKGITHSSCAPFSNLDIPQNGGKSDRTNFVWSRSLELGLSHMACGVNGHSGGNPDSDDVRLIASGVVACFCI